MNKRSTRKIKISDKTEFTKLVLSILFDTVCLENSILFKEYRKYVDHCLEIFCSF